MKFSKSSAMYWLPDLALKTTIPMPKTFIVPIADGDEWLWVSNPDTAKQTYQSFIENAIKSIGSFPIFVKTDEFAGKHDWKNTCFIASIDEVYLHLHNLACASSEVNLPISAFLFREFLPLQSSFKFFWGELPIAKERRYFVENNKVYCHHPYWDQSILDDAFTNDDATARMIRDADPNAFHELKYSATKRELLRDVLRQLNIETESEISLLTSYALQFSKVHPNDTWSVDFACDINGKWWLIDAALAYESWHSSTCQYASKWERQKESRS